MNAERWSRVGTLFDLSASMPPAERSAWLATACAGDDSLRVEVERLLDHDSQADLDGFLGNLQAADPPPQPPTAEPLAQGDPTAAKADINATLTLILTPQEAASVSDRFSPKAALTSAQPTRSTDEIRGVAQSRLRELPMIYALIFGVILLVRPIVLGRISAAIFLPSGIVAALLVAITILLSVRRFSVVGLGRIELTMTVALAGLLGTYEGWAIHAPALGEDRLMAERIMKNTILLLSLLMMIDATYVPKSWQRAAMVAALLAGLPLLILGGCYCIDPMAVRWVNESRTDGNKPLAVFGVDTVFLLTLAAISTFVTRTISRLRSAVVEARRFGQYRLGRRIGAGGMGEVYLAEHELLNRPCAVKLIRPEAVLAAGTIERFEREVRINATLSHPNTVEIFDYGRTEDGTYYYVMEYLPGLSLADLVLRHGPLPVGRAIYLLRQVTLALGEAHEAGLIHRDIKPSNIFAARRGGMDDVAKLLDFGLVLPERTATSSPRTSHEGQILGTPLYMSPEQAVGSRSLDSRSDIYSLGAVAYFLLTGRPPFNATTSIEAIIAHARDPVIPPSQLRPDVPADLDAVVLRCLAKDPTDRFPSAEALEMALGHCPAAAAWTKAQARQWWMDIKPQRP